MAMIPTLEFVGGVTGRALEETRPLAFDCRGAETRALLTTRVMPLADRALIREE